MFRMPKPTIVFVLLGTSFAALTASSVPGFAAPTCVGDLRLTGTELRDTPSGQQKSEAMGLYSSAINAHYNGQERRCLGDLNEASTVLASIPSSLYPFEPGDVGVEAPSHPEHHHGEHDHDHDHDHGHGHERG
ncbi:hypothetical protein FHT86_007184 [Rhizobium sp. BK313]|uniref:hypothetical protein n=1 Tax=Rhizobium sp. BK313 TaxID=2587081 RepID=UPI00105BB652|nr:hypothetical protein [Rhizobium sp. BK313]MBB3458855.1 hypothetical protein [Rhizobium sp. BK313]